MSLRAVAVQRRDRHTRAVAPQPEVDEEARPRLPDARGEAGVDPRPLVSVGDREQMLLRYHDVAVMRADLLDDRDMAVRPDPVRTTWPDSDRAD
jgi:hypothetical protein